MTDELEALLKEEQEEPELEISLLSARAVRYVRNRNGIGEEAGETAAEVSGWEEGARSGPSAVSLNAGEETGEWSGKNAVEHIASWRVQAANEPADGVSSLRQSRKAEESAAESPAREQEEEETSAFLQIENGEVADILRVKRNAVAGNLPRKPSGVSGKLQFQTGSQGENSARAFYQSLMRMRQAVDYQRPADGDRRQLSRESKPVPERKRDVLWVDRAFQRDARRYDGGFTWQ